MLIKLENIRPNPFRDLSLYPLSDSKVEALKDSIKSTGYWDNTVVRAVGDKYELSHGHHRLEALRQLGKTEAEFIVKDLDDAMMLKTMMLENLREGDTVSGERESIRSLVVAFGKGELSLPRAKGKNSQMRSAPSFLVGGAAPSSRENAYTASSLSEFLDDTLSKDKIKIHLRALEAIEQGHITEEDLQGLSLKKAKAVLKAVRDKVDSFDTPEREEFVFPYVEPDAPYFIGQIGESLEDVCRYLQRISELELKQHEATELRAKAELMLYIAAVMEDVADGEPYPVTDANIEEGVVKEKAPVLQLVTTEKPLEGELLERANKEGFDSLTEAEQDFLCEEVLPSIRKTGRYGQPFQQEDLKGLMSDPAKAKQLLRDAQAALIEG